MKILAIIVNKDGIIEVIGEGAVYFIDGSNNYIYKCIRITLLMKF